MATAKTVWGIDIGQSALKALKLRSVEGEAQVDAFDIIEHPKILSQPDADRKQLIRTALEQFLARNNIAGSTVVVSVPGQSSFTRFVKLPPVEPKKIPDIVRFEAEQQIPFPINDVVWRWQTFTDPDSPDVDVGLFAMKRVDVNDTLGHYSDVELPVDMVQMAPLSLYNFMMYDQQAASEGATLLADIGCDKTDLVVADGPRIWTRTIQIGGNNFTEALVKAFKLSFAKAEKLKRTAASSKYARQIFQAMRPVFADLVQEIQRSIGYYTSVRRESRFKRLVGLGGGFRLPGLQKFLEQNLNLPVVRIDSFNRLTPSPSVNAPLFTENVLSFAVSYGLALQGLDRTVVQTNLLPNEIVRQRVWAQKRPWFAASAAVLTLALGLPAYRAFVDRSTLAETPSLESTEQSVRRFEGLKSDFQRIANTSANEVKAAEDTLKLFGYRRWWPTFDSVLAQAVDQKVSHQKLLSRYAVTNAAQQAEIRKEIAAIARPQRRMVFLNKMDSLYVADVAKHPLAPTPAAGQVAQPKPGFYITISARSPLPHGDLITVLGDVLRTQGELIDQQAGGQMKLLNAKVKSARQYGQAIGGPGASGAPVATPAPSAGPAASGEPVNKHPDPLLPGEDMSNDTVFELEMLVSIEGDGLPAKPTPASPTR